MHQSRNERRPHRNMTYDPIRRIRSRFLRENRPAHDLRINMTAPHQEVTPSSTMLGRVVWVVIFIVAFLACIYQCGERVMHFISDPSQVNTFFIQNVTITLPSFIVCPPASILGLETTDSKLPNFNPFHYMKSFGKKTVKQLVTTDKRPMNDLWNAAALHILQINWTLGTLMGNIEIKDMDERPYITRVDTVLGRCTAFKAKPKIRLTGLHTFHSALIQGYNQFLVGYIIYWYPLEDLSLLKYTVRRTNMHSTMNSGMGLYFKISQVNYRNTKQSPCESNNLVVNQCLVNCIERGIYANTTKKCRLPYMQNSSVIAPCTTYDELNELLSTTATVLLNLRQDHCNCPRKCSTTAYMLQYTTTTSYPPLKLPPAVAPAAWDMGLSDLTISVIEEEAVYSGFALFSDLGGSIGLFLGFSALQIFEVIIVFFNKKCKR